MIKTVKRFSLKRILGQLHQNSNDFRSGTQSKFSFNRTRKKCWGVIKQTNLMAIEAQIKAGKVISIDFNQGYIAAPSARGILGKPTIEHLWTAGLAMAVRPGVDLSILNFGHSKLARFMPVTSFTGEDMFIRGHSDHNDSRQKKNVRPVQLDLLDARTETHLRRVFNIDADQVRAHYA